MCIETQSLATALLPKFASDVGYDVQLLKLLSDYQKNSNKQTYQAVDNYLLKKRTEQQKIMNTFSTKKRLDLNILDYEYKMLWSTAALPKQDDIVLLYQSSEYLPESTNGSSYKQFEDGSEFNLAWVSGGPLFSNGGALKFGSTLSDGAQTIQGYYFWCYNQTSITNSWCSNSYGNVGSATWSSSMTTDTTSSPTTTANTIPTGTNAVLFQYGTSDLGYSNYYGTTEPSYGPGMLQYVSYPYTGTTPYTKSDNPNTPYNIGVSYLTSLDLTSPILSTNACYFVGLMLGGGGPDSSSNVAYWTSTAISAIQYSIENPSESGLLYSKNPQPVSTDGYGMTFNLLAFDIEVGASGLLPDFLSLFETASNAGFQIMVIINHSCSYGISDATTLLAGLFQSEYVNFISPEMYTENIGTMNEYVANTQIPWMGLNFYGDNNESFQYYVNNNPNFNSGEIMAPGVLLYNEMPNSDEPGLMFGAGTNTSDPPNWTSFDGAGSGCSYDNPQVDTSGNTIDNYPANFTTTADPGANSFFLQLFSTAVNPATNLGGAFQWVNGDYQG